MPLSAIAPGIWAVESGMFMPGGVYFPLRATIVRLQDGGVWVHSPIAFDEETVAAIDALGPVRHLVAPNRLHHLHLGTAAARWPEAQTWGAPGLADKRPDLRLDHTLGEPPPWADEIDQVHIDGAPSIDETVFLHRPTGTLLVTDLVFHVHDVPNLRSRLLFLLVGVWRRLAQSRVWRFAVRDRAAAARGAHQVLDWPVQRVVPCHGRVVEVHDPAPLRRALGWMAAGAPRQLP